MEDQLITFETAKLAEEKGFIGKIGLGFRRGDYYNYKGELNGGCIDHVRDLMKKTEDAAYESPINTDNISAPTQSLLQRWLRETHNLLVVPTFSYNDNPNWLLHIEDINKMKIDQNSVIISGIDFGITSYETYEGALEAGLQQALNLI